MVDLLRSIKCSAEYSWREYRGRCLEMEMKMKAKVWKISNGSFEMEAEEWKLGNRKLGEWKLRNRKLWEWKQRRGKV